jgi:H+-translocating NAD(P) transhydrogenase subunit alpha
MIELKTMKIFVPKENTEIERRVALSPQAVKKLHSKGFQILIQKGSGLTCSWFDHDYEAAGAEIIESSHETLKDIDCVLCIRVGEAKKQPFASLKKDAYVIGLVDPYQQTKRLKDFAKQSLSLLSLELMPRITRAQSMDVLSSQSNLAGYKAVITAAAQYERSMAMFMTAAGTVKPAKVLILGVGVAGLQAIATAKRLGAVVTAFDIRAAAQEQVQSLGAKFVTLPETIMSQAGVYASEVEDDMQSLILSTLGPVVEAQDIIICTAQIPGKKAPILITKDMIEKMKAGSVIVDLAAATGGNTELTELGHTKHHHHVKIVAPFNILNDLAEEASGLYAGNLVHFLNHLFPNPQDAALNLADEIVKSTLLTHDSKIVHGLFGGEPPSSEKTPDEPSDSPNNNEAAA